MSSKLLLWICAFLYCITLNAQESASVEKAKFVGNIHVGTEHVEVVLESKPFIPAEHFQDVENWKINGRRPIGVDGHEVNPINEIKSMTVSWGGDKIEIPAAFYNDIYSPALNEAKAEPLESSEGIRIIPIHLPGREGKAIMVRMLSRRWVSAPYCVYWVICKDGNHLRFVEMLGL